MRAVTRYTEDLKATILTKLLSPNPPSVVELAHKFNIPYATIHTWKKKMTKKEDPGALEQASCPNDRPAEFKLKAINDTLSMTGEEQGAYCRQHGIYTHHLEEWKSQIFAALSNDGVSDKQHRVMAKRMQKEQKKLQADLRRKERALAEVSALLVLKKKADLLWGESEED